MTPISAEDQFTILTRDGHNEVSVNGKKVTLEHVRVATKEVDQEALIEQADADTTGGEWDGESSVNGKTAEHIRKRMGMKAGQSAYLVAYKGKVLIFQPWVPGQPGRVPLKSGKALDRLAETARQQVADQKAESLIFDALRKALKRTVAA